MQLGLPTYCSADPHARLLVAHAGGEDHERLLQTLYIPNFMHAGLSVAHAWWANGPRGHRKPRRSVEHELNLKLCAQVCWWLTPAWRTLSARSGSYGRGRHCRR